MNGNKKVGELAVGFDGSGRFITIHNNYTEEGRFSYFRC